MSRPRLDLAGVPQHVYQRGVNRADCFFSEIDRRLYPKCLAQAATRRGCEIHAYVLMSNHVHLLVTAAERGAVGAMMQDLGRRYVRIINKVHRRSGTLWEARYKSSLIDSENYLLTCHRYIELNPVRAGLASTPAGYPWSSFHYYAGVAADALITEHPVYHTLGASPEERRQAYMELIAEKIPDQNIGRLRQALHTSSALGSDIFMAQVAAQLGHPVGPPVRGRPARGASRNECADSFSDSAAGKLL